MKCKACGGAMTTAICPYCRAVDADLFEHEQKQMQEEKARLERIEERLERKEIRADENERRIKEDEKRAKFWDGIIIFFGSFCLFGFIGMIPDMQFELFYFIYLILGIIFIAWALFRKKRRNAKNRK